MPLAPLRRSQLAESTDRLRKGPRTSSSPCVPKPRKEIRSHSHVSMPGQKLLPGGLPLPLRCQFQTTLRQNVGCRAASQLIAQIGQGFLDSPVPQSQLPVAMQITSCRSRLECADTAGPLCLLPSYFLAINLRCQPRASPASRWWSVREAYPSLVFWL